MPAADHPASWVELEAQGRQTGPSSSEAGATANRNGTPTWQWIAGGAVGVVLVVVVVVVAVTSGSGGSKTPDPVPAEAPSVRLMVTGDFGRCSEFHGTEVPLRKPHPWQEAACQNQTELAPLFADAAETVKAEAVLNVGDAFYPDGLRQVDDEAFDSSFSKAYDAAEFPSLDVPWHSIMGNHEYQSSNMASMFDPLLIKRDTRWRPYYDGAMQFPAGGEKTLLEVILVDTTPFTEEYLGEAGAIEGEKLKYHFQAAEEAGFSPSKPESWAKYLKSSLTRLEDRLKDAKKREVPWIVVMGHNPIRSDADHADTVSMVTLVDPLLWEYGVVAYINGHDHDANHQEWSRCCQYRHPPAGKADGPVVVNEFLAHNGQQWVELYNKGDKAVDLKGWKLSTETNGADIEFPEETVLEPGAFKKVDFKGVMYTFEVGAESVTLRNPAGEDVSTLHSGFGWMGNGFSIGLHPDGDTGKPQTMKPTPDAKNADPLQAPEDHPEGAPPAYNFRKWLPAQDERFKGKLPGRDGQTMHYFTMGNGAGLATHVEQTHWEPNEHLVSSYYMRVNGFGTMEVTEDSFALHMHGDDGSVIHEVKTSKAKAKAVETSFSS